MGFGGSLRGTLWNPWRIELLAPPLAAPRPPAVGGADRAHDDHVPGAVVAVRVVLAPAGRLSGEGRLRGGVAAGGWGGDQVSPRASLLDAVMSLWPSAGCSLAHLMHMLGAGSIMQGRCTATIERGGGRHAPLPPGPAAPSAALRALCSLLAASRRGGRGRAGRWRRAGAKQSRHPAALVQTCTECWLPTAYSSDRLVEVGEKGCGLNTMLHPQLGLDCNRSAGPALAAAAIAGPLQGPASPSRCTPP